MKAFHAGRSTARPRPSRCSGCPSSGWANSTVKMTCTGEWRSRRVCFALPPSTSTATPGILVPSASTRSPRRVPRIHSRAVQARAWSDPASATLPKDRHGNFGGELRKTWRMCSLALQPHASRYSPLLELREWTQRVQGCAARMHGEPRRSPVTSAQLRCAFVTGERRMCGRPTRSYGKMRRAGAWSAEACTGVAARMPGPE